MKLTYIASAAVLLSVAALTGANAQSLKVREIMASQEKELVEEVDFLNKTCGTAIAVKLDWKGAPEQELQQYSAASYCAAALGGIRYVCESDMGKDAVKQKIKTVTCGFGGERSVTLKDSTVDYKINFSSSNDSDYVRDYLKNNL